MGPMRPMGLVDPMGPMGPIGPMGPLGPMGPMGTMGSMGPWALGPGSDKNSNDCWDWELGWMDPDRLIRATQMVIHNIAYLSGVVQNLNSYFSAPRDPGGSGGAPGWIRLDLGIDLHKWSSTLELWGSMLMRFCVIGSK